MRSEQVHLEKLIESKTSEFENLNKYTIDLEQEYETFKKRQALKY